MKLAIILAVAWVVMGAMRIPSVESWSILPDGTATHWWPQLGIRLFIASLFVEIAYLRRKTDKLELE